MEHISLNNREYRNYRREKYKYKYNLRKEENEDEFELINENDYDYQIKNRYKNISNKEISKGSRSPIINNDNISNYNQNKQQYFYNSINPNFYDNNYYNNYDDYNNGGNVFHTQYSTKNKNNNYINQGNYSNRLSNNSLSKKAPKKFSSLAKALKYFNDKIAHKNNTNLDNNSGKEINRNNEKKDLSSDKSNENVENKSFNNFMNKNNTKFRNFDIQTNYSKKKISSIIGEAGSKNNKIWSNINKELLPQKFELKNKFSIEGNKNKSKTPFKMNQRYFKNNLNSNTIEKNKLDIYENKINKGENRNDYLKKDEWIPNIVKKDIDEDDDNESRNKDFIGIKNNIKDNNEITCQEYSDRNNIKKYNTYKNYENKNKKKFFNSNKIYINKEPSEVKKFSVNNLLKKKNLFTKSSPDILNEFNLNIKNLNLKSPITYKDISLFNSTFSRSIKEPIRNNRSTECSFEDHPSLKNLNNIHVNLINPSSPESKKDKRKIPKIIINLEESKNKQLQKKNIEDINNSEKKTQIQTINNNNNNIIGNKKPIKQTMSQNDIVNASNINSTKINDSNLNINHKNQFYMKQNNKLIFQKKVNRSPPVFKKASKINKNTDNTQKNKSILKINQENSISNLNMEPNENKNNLGKSIYNYYFISGNKNINQDIDNNKIKNSKIINSINANNSSNGGKIYVKQKAKKAIMPPKAITQGKFELQKTQQNKNDQKSNNDINNYYSSGKIRYKINFKKKSVITKYYDYFIICPNTKKCIFSKKYLKTVKIPKIKVCHISKDNSTIYIIYKNKSPCYITKTRELVKKIIQPPVNDNCEFSKNIILCPPNENNKKIEIKNNTQVTQPKKNKKRKKRRKTRRLQKGKENNNNNNNNNNENKNDNIDNDNDHNIIDNNDNANENEENAIKEKEKENEDSKEEINNNINNNNKNTKIEMIKPNNRINPNNAKIIINDKSLVYKSSNDEKSGLSEKEIVINDIEKNSSIKKKFSPNMYNEDEFNDEENEENDDFRIASDEDEEISNDKYDKKDNENENKTEGKEILGDYDLNKNIKIDKNKMTNIEKTSKVIKLLEKLQVKRNSKEYEDLTKFFNNNNNYFENYNENDNENDNENYDNDEVDADNNNSINNYEGINKNIFLGTTKLNEIFRHQKNLKNNNENEDIDTDNNINYSNDNIDINNKNQNDMKYNLYRRKTNTYKKNVDYERIGSIFDKLEGIIDKKKIDNRDEISEDNNNENCESERCKTPLIKKGGIHLKNKISDFNLKEDDYIYNNKNNNYIQGDNDYNENIEDENNEEDDEDKKDIYMKKDMDMTKYKEIFNKQQIISKLESLMNKQKNKTNTDYNINNYMFNSPKIESEIDSDMNINKDTPGNRKEMKKNYLNVRNSLNNKKIYTFEEIISYKNKKICLNTNLLSSDVITHCNDISNKIEHKDSFKPNYKNINMNSNNYVYTSNTLNKNEKEPSMGQWARKDMTKEIEEAEKYVKELNNNMSKDNYKYKIIEILNTLTVDNYKNILNKMVEMLFLTDNNNKIGLNKPEYLLHNQFIFVEIILDKATIEKGYVVLYAKLCADLFIELIKLIKEYNNPDIQNQLINGENLKTILTSECRQRFDECISVSTLSKNLDEYEKKEIFLVLKKKFLGNMNFIAELINVKLLSQTKGFEFLDILYKRYKEIKNNEKIKFLNLEGAVTLLTKFGRIVMERQNPKHIQNLDNYMKDNICPIVSNDDNDNIDNKGLPNYLKFKIINLIEKKKNNWKDSLYEQSIIAKGKNNNISISHDLADSNIIDESLIDSQKIMNNTNKEKEDSIIILLKNDIENYVSFLNEHDIFNKKDLNEYNNKNENNDINNEYDWSITEELIIKARNELEEIIRCYIEVCIDYVTKEKNIFFCNEYIKNIVNYYSVDLTRDEVEKVNLSMNDLYLNIEDICIDNYFMLEVMGYLLLILLNNNLFYIEDLDKFLNEDKDKIIKITQVVKFAIVHSEEKYIELYNNFEKIKLYNDNKNIFEEYIVNPLKNNFGMKID